MTYRRVIIRKFGPPEVLQVIEEPHLPEPKPGEIRVRVLAVSAAFTDTMVRKGVYPNVKEKPPFAPGYDMVGVVDKPGVGTGKFKIGDRVCDLTVIGSYSEYLCVSEDRLIPVPESVDPGEAVSLILTYVTAYQMLHRVAKVRTGQSILVHGAGGAVGSALLELAKLENLNIFGTASAEKHQSLQQFGATLIDYRHENFVEKIRRLAPGGIDFAFDGLGWQSFKRSLKTIKPGGLLIAYGFSNAVKQGKSALILDFIRFKLMSILPGSRKKTFYSITDMRSRHPDWFANDLDRLFELLSNSKIKPCIWRRMPLSEAKQAHELIEQSKPVGKIILEVEP
jgi:NADPH:quinone reductase-like Zn-dependent oxidoreductase